MIGCLRPAPLHNLHVLASIKPTQLRRQRATVSSAHRRSRGWAKGAMPPPNFLENMVILCFERRFSKQNSVIRLKSNTFAPKIFFPPPNFWAGYATASACRALDPRHLLFSLFTTEIENVFCVSCAGIARFHR